MPWRDGDSIPSACPCIDGVDLAAVAGGYRVTDLRPGEWLKYTFFAQQAGQFRLTARAQGAGRLSLTHQR